MIALQIVHIDGIANTPAIPIAVRAWNALIEDGFSSDEMIMQFDDRAVLAWRGKKIVGIITWFKTAWCKQAHVKIGWVMPDYRGHGVYRQLFDALVAKIRAEGGVSEILGGVHPANRQMHEVMPKLGREVAGTIYRFRV